MAVSTEERVTHVGGHTKSLVDELTSLHATSRADGAEPVDVVLEGQETTGSDQSSQEMVVGGERVGRLDKVVEPRAEPDVLGDDLVGRLDVLALALLRVGDTPAGRTTGAGLLGQSQGNAVDERADDKSALAVTGATRHTQLGDIDASGRGAELLETVDDTVDTPGPGGQRTSRVRVAEEGVEGTLTTRTSTVLRRERVVGEGDAADGARDRQGRTANADDSGAGAGARLAERGADRRRLASDGDGDR